MNIKSVLRTYSLLRQLTDDEAALLETLRNFNDSEREAFVEALSDKPAGKKASKKASKKSARASSLGAAVKSGLQRREPTVGGFTDDADMLRCTAMIDDNGGEMECGETVDNNVHHKRTDPNFHPFVSTAPPAPAQSPANGGAESGTVNSGIEKVGAGSAG